MLEILNKTGFSVCLVPASDPNDADFAVIVVKGAFTWNAAGALAATEAPPAIRHADEYWGEPGLSSVRYTGDVSLRKPGVDIALVGKAYAPAGGATSVDVTLRVGKVAASARVYGDRHWYRGVAGWEASAPAKFSDMLLVYEHAYGGEDLSDPERPANEPRNPVGRGFSARGAAEQLEGLLLPNIESHEDPITSWESRPAPCGFGFVDPSWLPRARFAGTYDARWREERCPLLPDDFDDRFYQAAHPALVHPQPLLGGEMVQAAGVSRSGTLSFALPRYNVTADTEILGKARQDTLALDTIVIEPEIDRVSLTWRAAIPCTRKFLHIERVIVRATA